MLRETAVENGKVRGVACGWPSITAYYGIPYAAPPVGNLRWREPQPAADWDGVRDCARPSAKCWQLGVGKGSFFEREFYPVEEEMSEDCLYLNVWTPAQSTAERCPVIFWIHGGAFMTGYGHSAHFDGEHFARQGVILVTINYRLNVFGWMVDPALSAESEHGVSGNYALLDQIAALKWVRRNIAQFGGDPDNITVAGQSAGAACVQALVSSPLTQGDIARAIFQSGGGMDALPDMNYPRLAEVEARSNLQESLGVASLEEARALSGKELLERWRKTMPGPAIQRTPVIDGYVLPEPTADVVYERKYPRIPYLVGYTEKEGIVVSPTPESYRELAETLYGKRTEEYLSLCPMEGEEAFASLRDNFFAESLQAGCESWAELLEENGDGPVYVYRLARMLPGDDKGAFHAADLWYVFQTFMRGWRPWEGRDYEIARTMNTCWANFAKTGNPNGERLPEWTPFTRENPATLVIGDETTEMEQLTDNPHVAFRRKFLVGHKK
ncbi:MAG: carboxylesterase family protein [Lachnospiraceae bacterium]|nr:carboxylesterase family protein [Lachnospiraceae bacterium]